MCYTSCADELPHSISLVTCMWLNAGSKVRNFDRDIKSKLKIMSLEVDSACNASSSMSLDDSPKRALVFTDTRTSKLFDELLADMILRPH